MKVFLLKIVQYVLFLAIILGMLDFVVFPNNLNVMSVKHKLLQNSDAEVLILGNSHTFFGIAPHLLENKAINIANKSRKLETDYFILKKYMNQLRNLEKIILPISYYTFFADELSIEEKRLYYHFFKLKEYDQGTYYNSLLLNLPLNELLTDAVFKFNKVSKLGWRSNNTSYQFNEEEVLERVGNISKKLQNTTVLLNNVHYLNDIIKLCDINRVKLVLLLPPYHPDFYKYSERRYRNKIVEVFNQLDLTNTFCIDSDSLNIREDRFFENVDHLNRKGAFFFTKKIDSILINVKNE